MWSQLVRFKLKGMKRNHKNGQRIEPERTTSSSVNVQLEPAATIVVQRPPEVSQTPRRTTPSASNSVAEPSPTQALMSPLNHLSLSNTSNTKRSSESIELPEGVDNKRRRLALSFFEFMGSYIREGVVTPGEIMQFCNRYNQSGTHQEIGEDDSEMPGLQYDQDVCDYNDSGTEEQDVGAEEHGLPMHEDFHPGMDLRNGIPDSCSPAPIVNPSPSIPGSDYPRQLVNTLSKFAQSAESLSGDSSDDSQGGLNQEMLENDPAGDMEGSAAENQDEEVMEEEEDKEYEEDADDELMESEDDEFMESEDEDWNTAEEEDGESDEQEGEGINESEVTSSGMAAEPAECVDEQRKLGDSEEDNERPPQVRTIIPRGERDPQLFNIDLIPAIWPDEFREDIGVDDECFEVPGKPAPPPEEYVIKDSDDESTKAKKIMYVSLPCFPIV